MILRALILIFASTSFIGCSKKSNITEETLAFVENEQIDIQGKELPSGDIYSLEECFKRNRYIERTIQKMVFIAHEIIEKEELKNTVYILNTTGTTRDDFGIGYDYSDEKMKEHLNKTAKAKIVLEWAQDLPPKEREEYLEQWRQNGWDGYL